MIWAALVLVGTACSVLGFFVGLIAGLWAGIFWVQREKP